jgi:hypothetical protein
VFGDNPAERGEVVDEGPGQRLHLLVRNDGDLDPPGVLEARRKEVNPSTRPVEEVHPDASEVVLRELAGQPLEAHHRTWCRRADGADHLVERALRTSVAGQLRPPEQFEAHQLRLVPQPRHHAFTIGHGLGGTPNPSVGALPIRIGVCDHRLTDHALDASFADGHQLGDLVECVSRRAQHLNGVPLEQVDHRAPHGQNP